MDFLILSSATSIAHAVGFRVGLAQRSGKVFGALQLAETYSISSSPKPPPVTAFAFLFRVVFMIFSCTDRLALWSQDDHFQDWGFTPTAFMVAVMILLANIGLGLLVEYPGPPHQNGTTPRCLPARRTR